MTTDDERHDRELRRLASASADRARASMSDTDIDEALDAVRTAGAASSRRRIGTPSRWLVLGAAAATVSLLVGLLLAWPAESEDRLSSVTSGPDGVTEPAAASTTASPLSSAQPSTIPIVDEPSIALDRDGRELATFRLVDGRAVIEPTSTPFTEALLDLLLNRSTILGSTSAERSDALFRGGLRIQSTLDPSLQAAAEIARNRLPDNTAGIDAAIVALDTRTGAVRAFVSGDPSDPDRPAVNTALQARETGSAVKIFVLAAALQAGAQPDDVIDGLRGCVLPGPWSDPDQGVVDEPVLQIIGGVGGFVGSLRDIVARSVNCGAARLSHIVGLERVVDTTGRMASSAFLPDGQAEPPRSPIEPVADLALGVNPMTPLDMASGLQTIANVGVHHQPYFVEFVDGPDGARRYTHVREGVAVLDERAALGAVDVLTGVITEGTGRRHPLSDDRPAIGKTGTVQDNTDAWFVGATPQLTTAVWVGDPVAETPMVGIPEFEATGVQRVQGGMFPAEIWRVFTDAALVDELIERWDPPPAPERAPARLVLPGFECLAFTEAGETVVPDLGATVTTVPPGVTDPTHPLPSVMPESLPAGCAAAN